MVSFPCFDVGNFWEGFSINETINCKRGLYKGQTSLMGHTVDVKSLNNYF